MKRVRHRHVSRIATAALIFLILPHTQILGLSSIATNRAPTTTGRTSSPRHGPEGYSEWFYSQRASHQGIPRDAYPNALLQRDQMTSTFTTAGGSWTPAGPSPIQNCSVTGGLCSGRVTAIAPDPTHLGTVYLGAAQGGVWKSTDNGTSWIPLTDSQPSLAVGSVAVDSSGNIYVGTGEGNQSCDSYYGAGVLRSTDGGNTWTRLGATTFSTLTIGRIVVNPSNPANILAVTSSGYTDSSTDACGGIYPSVSQGVYESFDSGATWSLKLPGTGYDLVLDPTDPSTIYAAVGGFVSKSTDSGSTWTMLGGGLPAGRRTSLAISQSAPLTIYAVINVNAQAQLFKSLDKGNTWSQLNTPPNFCGTQCWYDLYVAVDPTNHNMSYLGGLDLYRSSDGGGAWTDIGGYSGYIHSDQHAIAFSPFSHDNVYVGNDGGVWSTTTASTCSPSACWTNLNSGLDITQFQFIATHPTDPNTYFGGTQDNGSPERSGTSNIWNMLVGGDGGWTAFDPTNPLIMYHNFYNISPQRSVDGGSSWSSITNGINTTDFSEFYVPLAMDASNPSNLYLGTCSLYKTTDRGNTWMTIFTLTQCGGLELVSAIAVAPSNGNYVYFGTNRGKFYTSTDGGASFVQADTGLPSVFLTRIAVDPFNPLRAAVTFSGFGNGHVYITTNSGASWVNISSNLPDIPTNSILIDPTNHFYVGTDIGVFLSNNSGETWNVLGTGLPNASVFDLALTADGRLAAATHGRGVWLTVRFQDFAISTDRTSAISTQGLEANFTVKITPIGVFSSNVTLSCTGQLPPSTSCSFSSSNGMTPFNTTLTIATSPFTPTGYYPVTITGATNTTLHSVTTYLRVSPPVIFQYSLTFKGMNATIVSNLTVNSTSGALIGPVSLNAVNGTDGTPIYSRNYSANLSIDNFGKAVFIGEVPTNSSWLALSCAIYTFTGSSQCIFSRSPDLDHDGRVSIIDAATVAFAYDATPNSPSWNPAADFDGDGVVNIFDAALVAFFYGVSVSR